MNRPGVSTDSHTKPSGVAARARARAPPTAAFASDSPSENQSGAMAFAASSAFARRSAHVSPKSTNVFLSASALRASFASKCTGYQKLRMAASSPGVDRLSSSAAARGPPPRRGCAWTVATSGAITARVGSDDARESGVDPLARRLRVASIERDNGEGQSRRSGERKYRAPCTNSWRDASGRRAWRRCGVARSGARGSRAHATHLRLPIRVARGSRARARVARPRRARARRKSTPAPRRARDTARIAIAFRLVVSCVRACACCACYPPLRPLRRVRVRGAASGRSRARPARRHGRACGPPDAHRYCRRLPRGALSGSALALRGGQTRTSQHTWPITNARIDFEPTIWRSGFFRGV